MTDLQLTAEQLLFRRPQVCGMLRGHKMEATASYVSQLADALARAMLETDRLNAQVARMKLGAYE